MNRFEPANLVADARQVGRVYGARTSRVVALEDVSLAVHAGDRISLMGRSGSGKSTLLHILAGLDGPSSGTVAWPGIGNLEAVRSGRVAMMMQSPSLVPWLTVIENVTLPLQLGGRQSVLASEAALRALTEFQLDDLASKLPEQISGGQAQRVSLVRATVTEPALLLADEPTGQVDHATAKSLLDALFGWADRANAAVVVATHDRAIADRFSTVLSMRHGRLVRTAESLVS